MSEYQGPRDANEFIERSLIDLGREIEQAYDGRLLAFDGQITDGSDDYIRDAVEELRGASKEPIARLVVCLTTNGGFIEVVQRIVETLRYNATVVEFIVPSHAYSAGTVLAMSGNAIHMDYYSRLGPIDPQAQLADGKWVPALGYLEQYERLMEKAENGSITAAETSFLINRFDPAELYKYEQSRELSVTLLKDWLVKYKFQNWKKTETRGAEVTDVMRKNRAEEIARQLQDTSKWHSHSRGISMEILRRALKLVISDFGEDNAKRESTRSYHNLLSDYVAKLGVSGAVHAKDRVRLFRF